MSGPQDTTPVPAKRRAFEPASRLLKPPEHDPEMPRPSSIVAGTVLILVRVVAGVVVLAGIAFGWGDLMSDPDSVLDGFAPTREGQQAALWAVLAIGGTVLLIDLVLAVLVYRGHNWSRVVVMLIAVLSISTTFFARWAQGQEITLEGTFVSLSIDILLLLALSSRSAAAYARRNERR